MACYDPDARKAGIPPASEFGLNASNSEMVALHQCGRSGFCLNCPMMNFRIFYLDHRGQVSASEQVRAMDDAAAIELGEALRSAGHYRGLDVWQAERHVFLDLNETSPALN